MKKFVWAAFVVLMSWPIFVEAKPRSKAKAPTVRQIELIGNKALATDDLMKHVTLKTGSPLDREQLRFSMGVLESVYRDNGYFAVDVSTTVALIEPDQADVRFSIREGDLYYIDQIRIEGNKITSEKNIRRHLGVQTGDVFSQKKIFDGNRELYTSGYYDSIDLAYSTATAVARTIDVVVRVKERASRFLKGSAGYGSETKERFTLGAEDTNFFGNEKKLDFTVTHSGFLTNPQKYRTTLVKLSLSQPYFLDSPFEGQTQVSREYRERESYDSITTAWRSSLGRRFGRSITASLRYRFEGVRINNALPDAMTPDQVNISAVGPTFTYDNTNDPFLPFFGWRVLGTVEEGITFFVGNLKFHKLEARAGRFETFFHRLTLFGGVQSGIIFPHDSENSIPITERYFIGGANTVRGFNERELGPKDIEGAPIGGEAFATGNLEARHPIWKKLFGVVFFDAGQLYQKEQGTVWPHIRAQGKDDFRYSTGFGFRLHTPVGPLRLEAGYQLNPVGSTRFSNRTAIHFSIGEVF